MGTCADCIEIKKIGMEVEKLRNESTCRDMEHETTQDNLSRRITSMEQKFEELKKEVKEDIKSIKADIPIMFDNAINKIFARLAKWGLLGIGAIILVTLSKTYGLIFLEFLKKQIEG